MSHSVCDLLQTLTDLPVVHKVMKMYDKVSSGNGARRGVGRPSANF